MSAEFIHLSCASCGAALEVYDDIDRFACGYCRTEMLVQRRGRTVALKCVTDAIQRVQAGTDKAAAELALARLRQDLATLEARAAGLKPVTPPLSGGCAIAMMIPGVLFGLWVASGIGGFGMIIVVTSILIPFTMRSGKQHARWKEAKESLDAEMTAIRREIDQHMMVVGSSGPRPPDISGALAPQ